MIDHTKEILENQMREQKTIIKQHKRFLTKAPKGSLVERKRNGKISYFRRATKIVDGRYDVTEKCIDGNVDLIAKLSQKQLSSKIVYQLEKNIEKQQKFLKGYSSIDEENLQLILPERFRRSVESSIKSRNEEWEYESYQKRVDTSRFNIHETLKGDLVGSKSEVIIANALYVRGIPYHHDEMFPVRNINNGFYYLDFITKTPIGEMFYWEHFGLLDDQRYAEKNTEKLLFYHSNGLELGKNLIVTVDDQFGNCNSPDINRIIDQFLMPHFL
ncbi:MAG: hypothetical protein RSE98_07865 [Anaerovoracaceae bacterium]